ncbi:DUF2958 domain-containing protein [Nitrobacter sp.]|jgi:hypothetical protein|uniref:DUF2958 domain-containing protein n=1 Tax=Nitrobacter sp. TaxID=29420 RepID=UPI0029CAAFF5|nr:DUF2958 domain-containing protein [Nitrobacter sp.]
MTLRVLRTEALIPDELLARLIENGRTSEERDGFDPFPVVKLFTPDAGATWLITEAYPEGEDVRLFGLCDLGMGCPELGYLMLSEIENVRGLPVERDLYFKAEHRLSTYTTLARHAGRIDA